MKGVETYPVEASGVHEYVVTVTTRIGPRGGTGGWKCSCGGRSKDDKLPSFQAHQEGQEHALSCEEWQKEWW